MAKSMHPLYKKIGKKLHDLRKRKGFTQQELAERAELTTAFLSYLENGTRKGSMDAYIKLAEALGVPVEILFVESLAKGVFEISEPAISLEGLSPSDTRAVRDVIRSLRKKKRSTPRK